MESPRPSASVPISSRGLTVIVEPAQPDVDIVFIHGFKGGPEQSWTEKCGPQTGPTSLHSAEPTTPRLKRHISLTSVRGNHATSATCFWPRDLLPTTFPNARIMTYGYDIEMVHWLTAPANKQTIYDIAHSFMLDLDAKREGQPRRPILFVAHSLGGIIVKEMLWQCSGSVKDARTQKIFKSTVGIMFFGVPHGGTNPQGFFMSFARMMIRALGYSMNRNISDALLPGADRLQKLSDNFGPIAKERNWKIYSFQEQYGSKLTMGEKVVEDGSSHLGMPDIETTQHIGKDHFHMTRFSGAEDPDYIKVEAGLKILKAKVERSTILLAIQSVRAKIIQSLLYMVVRRR